ncbi:MAG TPA: PilZ domain-containing protein [Nitrospirota bacterium]|nr:PilZ domain-containing protein [Nitrospirota bacterium]
MPKLFEKEHMMIRKDHRHASRQLITVHWDCVLGLISFKDLKWKDSLAHVVDISGNGVGIESHGRIEPGFVWFHERLGGHRSGVLLWSRKQDGKYRGGIKFVPLSVEQENYLREQISDSPPHRPVRDPSAIINTIIESLKANGN